MYAYFLLSSGYEYVTRAISFPREAAPRFTERICRGPLVPTFSSTSCPRRPFARMRARRRSLFSLAPVVELFASNASRAYVRIHVYVYAAAPPFPHFVRVCNLQFRSRVIKRCSICAPAKDRMSRVRAHFIVSAPFSFFLFSQFHPFFLYRIFSANFNLPRTPPPSLSLFPSLSYPVSFKTLSTFLSPFARFASQPLSFPLPFFSLIFSLSFTLSLSAPSILPFPSPFFFPGLPPFFSSSLSMVHFLFRVLYRPTSFTNTIQFHVYTTLTLRIFLPLSLLLPYIYFSFYLHYLD